MAQLFYDENDPRKKREMRGDKTPMDMPQKLAGVVGAPHSNVRIDTGVNIEDDKTYKRVLPDFGATRVKGPRKAV